MNETWTKNPHNRRGWQSINFNLELKVEHTGGKSSLTSAMNTAKKSKKVQQHLSSPTPKQTVSSEKKKLLLHSYKIYVQIHVHHASLGS